MILICEHPQLPTRVQVACTTCTGGGQNAGGWGKKRGGRGCWGWGWGWVDALLLEQECCRHGVAPPGLCFGLYEYGPKASPLMRKDFSTGEAVSDVLIWSPQCRFVHDIVTQAEIQGGN